MTTGQFFISAWNWNPWVIAICAVTIVTCGLRHDSRRKIGWLLAGVAVFFFTLVSPVDTLADGYLFSAHMLQHLLLLLIVPPLILLSLPLAPVPERFQIGRWKWLNWISHHPLITWLFGRRRDVDLARANPLQRRRDERVDPSSSICHIAFDGLRLLVADHRSAEQATSVATGRNCLFVQRVRRLHRSGNHYYVRSRRGLLNLSSSGGPARDPAAHSKSMGTDARQRPATGRSVDVGSRMPDLFLRYFWTVRPLAWQRWRRRPSF